MEVQLAVPQASTESGIEAAFATLVQQRVGAVFIQAPNSFFLARREQLVALAARHAIAAIYGLRDYVDAGGLISYGTSLTDAYRQVGVYTGKISREPSPLTFRSYSQRNSQLVINLKTAKALGLTVSARTARAAPTR